MSKEKYISFIEKCGHVPIFYQAWWLDALANAQGSKWYVSVLEKDNEVIAAWPYHVLNKLNTSYSLIPILSGYCGIWSGDNQLSNKDIEVLSEPIKKLGLFKQNFHPADNNWMGLWQSDFRLTTHYTYRIEDIDSIQSNMQPRLRRAINNNNEYKVSALDDINVFYTMNALSWSVQKTDIPYTKAYLEILDNALNQRGKRRIFQVRDNEKIIGALYVIVDGDTAYLLAMGSDPAYRNTVAVKKLIYESILLLQAEVSRIDCMASMVEGISNFYNNFGMNQDPYLVVSHAKSKLFSTAALLLKDTQF